MLVGKMKEKGRPGRKQHPWLRNIPNWRNISDVVTLFRKVEGDTLHIEQ